jgi:signal transduction histidine kinase
MMDADASQRMRLLRGPLGVLWRRLTLSGQFTIAALAVSLVSILVLGNWVSRQIEENVIDNAAASTAIDIGHFIAPHLQELASVSSLSEQSLDGLDRVMDIGAFKSRIETIKVWREDGRLVYSTNRELIGRRFTPDLSLQRAWSGTVSAEFNKLDAEESAPEHALGRPLLEVYAPVYETQSGAVIAVAEFYVRAEGIHRRLRYAKWKSWIITGVLALATTAALFSIVADGSRTIERQREALTERIAELSSLLRQNKILRDRVERGARQATEDNERFLRQIGSDLHDGPAQLIGLALLRLDSTAAASGDDAASSPHAAMRDALDQIRDICAGLLLPETEGKNLKNALLVVIRDHERRTRTTVSFASRDLPENVARSTILCLCRFVQEGLTNAFRHAEGKGQLVCAWLDGAHVIVEVSDRGPGIRGTAEPAERMRLGLVGLRGRIESIGGTMSVSSHSQGGTCLTARLPVNPAGGSDGG